MDTIKQQAVREYLESLEKGNPISKAEMARRYNTSARSFGRWLEQYQEQTDDLNQVEPKAEIAPEAIEEAKDEEAMTSEVEYRFLATARSISITRLVDGREDGSVVIDRNNDAYNEVLAIIQNGGMSNEALDEAYHLASPAKMVEFFTQGRLSVDVAKGEIVYHPEVGNPYPVDGLLTNRIMSTLRDKGIEGAKVLINFMENLMLNPSFRAVKELYGFLEHNDIELTEDGHFLAWKKVRSDYLDIHSGTIRNAPGDTPRVDRNQVDEDSNRTCSHGLHVCAKSYLQSFGSNNYATDRVVKVKVHPSDVVAIPKDYNNSKMRCAGYEVLEDVTYRV